MSECKYCKKHEAFVDGKHLGLSIRWTDENSSETNAYIRGYDKQGWDITERFVINYCPSCGRKLKSLNLQFN